MRPFDLLVLPRKTSHSPAHAHIGEPDLFSAHEIKVHISCCFTWDLKKSRAIALAWKEWGANVQFGGPAFDDPGGEFTPGLYTKRGITITSRGCPRECPWCYVPRREGKIRELKTIHVGNIVQDNNLLACSKNHINKVIEMLRTQKQIRFLGGIDSRLLTDKIIDQLRELAIKEIWLAADARWTESATLRAITKLRMAGFPEYKIRCYVLCGFSKDDNPGVAEERLMRLRRQGCYPFAQLYDQIENKNGWHDVIRKWSRPAIYNSDFTRREEMRGRGLT